MPTTNLRSALEGLASQFANSVLDAIRTASLDELTAGSANGVQPRRGRGRPRRLPERATGAAAGSKSKATGRLARRSPEQVAEAVERVVALVKKHKDGLRAGQIRADLGLEAKELPRILREAIEKKALRTKGQRRGTRYFSR